MTCVAFPHDAELIELREVAAKFRVKYKSAQKWHYVGILVGGVRVKLEVQKVGSNLWTTWAAVQKFIKALNAPPPGKPERYQRTGRTPAPLRKRTACPPSP